MSPTFSGLPLLQSPVDDEVLAPPSRPDYGGIGRTIQLRANHFQVKIPNCVLYHYDISIVPDKCPRRVNREIIDVLVKTHVDYFANQMPVFDGRKNLYSRKPLPIGRDRVCVISAALVTCTHHTSTHTCVHTFIYYTHTFIYYTHTHSSVHTYVTHTWSIMRAHQHTTIHLYYTYYIALGLAVWICLTCSYLYGRWKYR